jgi:hypothetical protein
MNNFHEIFFFISKHLRFVSMSTGNLGKTIVTAGVVLPSR